MSFTHAHTQNKSCIRIVQRILYLASNMEKAILNMKDVFSIIIIIQFLSCNSSSTLPIECKHKIMYQANFFLEPRQLYTLFKLYLTLFSMLYVAFTL